MIIRGTGSRNLEKYKRQLLYAEKQHDYKNFLLCCLKLSTVNMDINHLAKNIKNSFEEIGINSSLPKSMDELGKKQFDHEVIYIENSSPEKKLQQTLYRTIIVLTEYKKEINTFVNLERKFFSFLMHSQYKKCLNILDEIEKEICYSQWLIHARLTIYHLLKDDEKIKNLLDSIGKNYRALNGKIFLHLHSLKLNMYSSKTASLETVIHNFKFHKNKRKKSLIQNDHLNYSNNLNDHFLEKKVLSPFNTKSNYEDLKFQILNAYNHSIIDLYKAYASVITELQIDENKYFKKYIFSELDIIITKTINLSYDANLIKLDNYIDNEMKLNRYLNYKKKDNDLFSLYNKYLHGDFDQVIIDTLLILKDYPYNMDAIYYLVHSLTFIDKKDMQRYLNDFTENSLVIRIIENYYNLLIGENINTSIEELKKILLLFGSNSQWSMYLYHLIAKYLCLNNDQRTKTFTNAIKYSYFNHPRLFYSFDTDIKINLIERLSQYKSIKKVFLCDVDENLKEEIFPEYRADYIIAKSNHDSYKMLDLVKKLIGEELENAPYFYQERIKFEYVNLLIENKLYKEAAKIIYKSVFQDKIPLCVYNYKKNEDDFLDSLKHTPYYPLFVLLDQPDNTIAIHYAMQIYLSKQNKTYKKVSALEKILEKSGDDEEIKVLLECLKMYNKEKYVVENVPTLRNREEVLVEQLKLLRIVKKFGTYDIEDIEEQKLEKKLKLEKNRVFADEHRLFLDIQRIKIELYNIFLMYVDEYHLAPEGKEEYLFYKQKHKQKDTLYESNENWKEEKFEKLLRLFIEGEYSLIASNIGLLNLINENIIHNHLDDTLIDTFIRHNLYAKQYTEDDEIKYDINGWENNRKVREAIVFFSKSINTLTNEIKIKIKDETNKGYFNFNYLNVFSEEKFFHFYNEVQISGLDNSPEQLFDSILFKIIEFINSELYTGQEKLISDLKRNIQNFIDEASSYSSNREFKNSLQALENELNVKVYNIISDWFQLSHQSSHEDFTINEIIEILKDRYNDIDSLTIKISSDIEIHGTYFIDILNIFYIIVHNFAKHASEKTMNITIEKIKDSYLIRTNNKTNKPITKSNLSGGMKYLEDTLKKLDSQNTLDFKSLNNIYTLEIKIVGDIIK